MNIEGLASVDLVAKFNGEPSEVVLKNITGKEFQSDKNQARNKLPQILKFALSFAL
jgi:hypothetical protein